MGVNQRQIPPESASPFIREKIRKAAELMAAEERAAAKHLVTEGFSEDAAKIFVREETAAALNAARENTRNLENQR